MIPQTPLQAIAWQIDAHVRPEDEALRSQPQGKACFVLGTNVCDSQYSDPKVTAAYKGQARVEGGVRILKDPLIFVSLLFVKKPSRLQGLRRQEAFGSSARLGMFCRNASLLSCLSSHTFLKFDRL
jgi:hypothetical protein